MHHRENEWNKTNFDVLARGSSCSICGLRGGGIHVQSVVHVQRVVVVVVVAMLKITDWTMHNSVLALLATSTRSGRECSCPLCRFVSVGFCSHFDHKHAYERKCNDCQKRNEYEGQDSALVFAGC